MKKKALPKNHGKRGPAKRQPPAELDALIQTLPPLPKNAAVDWVREQCKFVYIVSREKVSLGELVNHSWFKGRITLVSLERWSTAESWVELRRQHAEQWRRQITEETGRELIEARREWLQNLRTIAGHVFKQLLPDKKGKFKLEAQSYESMVQAFVKAIGLMDSITQNSLDDVMPDVRPAQLSGATEKSETALKPDLTLEEARIASRAILEARLAEQRRLAAAYEAKKGQGGGT